MFAKTSFSFILPRTIERQPEVDELLNSSENARELAEYIFLNPGAKDYLNLILYNLANSLEKYQESDFEFAKMILAAGANSDYIHNNDNSEGFKSVLEAAADLGKDWLVEILLNHGAKTTLFVEQKLPSKDILKMFCETKEEEENIDRKYEEEVNKVLRLNEAEKIKDMVRRKKLPIQIAFKNYQRRLNESATKTCTLLSKKTIYELDLEFLLIKLLNKQYAILYKKISNGFAEAIKNNQQFIIMAGECHEGLSSLIIEQMILLICKEAGISTLLTEHNKYIEDYLTERGYIPTRKREWLTSLTINKQLKSLEMHAIPVDLGHFGARKIGDRFDDYENLTSTTSGFDNTSLEGMRYRNGVIRNVIIGGIKKHSMLFVGTMHLFGLREETPFPETIKVLSINAEKIRIKKELQGTDDTNKMLQYSLESSDILQTEGDLDEFCEFLSPEVVIEYVNKVHYEFQLKKNQDLLFFTKPYNPLTQPNEILEVGTKKSEEIPSKCLMF